MRCYFQGWQIKQVTPAKYLGVTTDEYLTWYNHVKTMTSKTGNNKQKSK